MESKEDFLAHLEKCSIPFARLLGIKVLSATTDCLDAAMLVREDMCTIPAILHGGAMMALADTVGAMATVVYRRLADEEKNAQAREALLAAADDEDRNGNLLALMSTPKTRCEKCEAPLAVHTHGYSCSFQCTFCNECAIALEFSCPNCRGELETRQRLQGLE